MPSVNKSITSNQYFIFDGTRRELSEFDMNWVNESCDLEVTEVY